MDLREIFRTLYGTEPQGCTDGEIKAVEKIFGALPDIVKDFWRTFGRTRQINCGQDNWCLPELYEKWAWLINRSYLVLLNENQGCCQAGIRREDLSLSDPPVYNFVNDEIQGLISPSVSEFLRAALLYEGVFQLEYSPEEFFEISAQDLMVIQEKLIKYPAVLQNWFEMEITFYSNRPDNLVVVMDVNGYYQALYGGANQESYAALLEVMEGLGEPI